MKKISTVFIIFSIVTTNICAQTAMGKWRTYMAYNSVSQIAASDQKIYGISNGSMYSVNKNDLSIETYSKTNGLNDSYIDNIKYDDTNKQLLIIYNNGNIDIYTDNGITNIPDLYNKQTSSTKKVNQITFNGNYAYLSCSFGILVLNLEKHEITDTYYIGDNGQEVNVLSTVINGNYIYAATKNYIYKGDLNNTNLVNYEYWNKLTNFPNTSDTIASLSYFNNSFILQKGTRLYKSTSENLDNWSSLLSNYSIKKYYLTNDKLVFTDNSNKKYISDTDYAVSQITGIDSISDAYFDSNKNLFWFAGRSKGIISYVNTTTPEISTYKPNGPISNIPYELTFSNQKLFMLQGGRWAGQYSRPGYVMIYENGTWTNLDPADIKAVTGYKALDFMNVAVDPSDNKHFFVTSYGTGLYEFKDNSFYHWYNNQNTTLETLSAGSPYSYIRLDGAIFDSDNNLLMVNMYVNNSIKILDKNGNWKQLGYSDSNKPTLGKILISNQNKNQKWINSVRYTPGIFVYDDNGTIDDQSDDQSRFFSTFTDNDNYGSYITPTYYYCSAQDKNGVIWVGTDEGPLLFYNPNKVFDADYTCTRVKIPRNDGTNQADYLLETDRIKAIAIDGANRKWIGTESSGVYLMSENGQETIKHFTTSNSPLLSDNILSIAINPISGEVFFGTDYGLISYQSDASESNEYFDNVHAYPNPVRESYNGIITIKGLVTNTQLKITDLNGNLICETQSNGGTATWDGKNSNGKKVSTGIYLVICVNEDGTQNAITKIMVIN